MFNRKFGFIVGLAMVTGAVFSIFLPEDQEKVVKRLFNEVNYQSNELRNASEQLLITRNRLMAGEGSLQGQPVLQAEAAQLVEEIDKMGARVAPWVKEFSQPGERDRKALLLDLRERASALIDSVQTLNRKGRILLGDPGAS